MTKFETKIYDLMKLLETNFKEYTFEEYGTDKNFSSWFMKKDGELYNSLYFEKSTKGKILVKSFIVIDIDSFDNNKDEFVSMIQGLVDKAPETDWLFYGETIDLYDTGRETWEMKPTYRFVYENDEQFINELKQSFNNLTLGYASIADYNKLHNNDRKPVIFSQGEYFED